MAQKYTEAELIPTVEDFETIISAKISFEQAKATKTDAELKAWATGKKFKLTPWGIGYSLSKFVHTKSVMSSKNRGAQTPKPKSDIALRYFIVAVMIGWQELIDNLKITLSKWGYTSEDIKQIASNIWQNNANITKMINNLNTAQSGSKIILTEAVEKHQTLNSKLFTKDEFLKERVRNKMLEVVDEFLANLKEQDIKIKVDDILLIGSNASYNYTKDSDIDLHILANTKATTYEPEIAEALYGAYRTIFNKQLDIKLFDIPLEIFVETEDSPRVSNGVYSVKKDKWLKKPIAEDIPEYDKEALDKLVTKWEAKCKDIFEDHKADKLKDEKKVVKLLDDIYLKLRKKGVSIGEYSIENLAFKELRNKGHLDKLKDARYDLISKRLSLEERLNSKARNDAYAQIARVAGTPPIIQDNGMFFIYNLKESEISSKVQALKVLPIVKEVFAYDNGKYDFSDVMRMAVQKIPNKYYNIRGVINC